MIVNKKLCRHLVLNCLPFMLGLLVAATAAWGQAEQQEPVPDFEHVEQQGMELKQSVLTYSEDQRQALVSETRAALQSFDRRINRLQGAIAERSDNMSAAARRYADDLMNNLEHEREQLAEWFTTLREDSDETWDHIIYGFSSAYDNFYDSWENLEAQFGSKY